MGGEQRQAGGDKKIDRSTDRQRKCWPRPRGDERCRTDETSRKGKGKGNGGKGEHEGKEEDLGTTETARDEGERRNGSEWRQAWGPVAHTPSHDRPSGRGDEGRGEERSAKAEMGRQ